MTGFKSNLVRGLATIGIMGKKITTGGEEQPSNSAFRTGEEQPSDSAFRYFVVNNIFQSKTLKTSSGFSVSISAIYKYTRI